MAVAVAVAVPFTGTEVESVAVAVAVAASTAGPTITPAAALVSGTDAGASACVPG